MEIGLAFCRRTLATNPAAVSLLLALLLHSASGLPATHPLRPAVDEINESGPFIGLVMAYSAESDALRSSGEFIPSNHLPWLDLYGRRFHIGSIRDVNVIYVMSGRRRLNAGVTVQILLDIFSVRGIVHYGTTGSANDSMSFGDVSIPKYVAFTGSWTWMKFDSETKMANMLSFAAYNAPAEGNNLLSSVVFKSEDLFVDGKPMVEVFWLQMESQWYEIAKQLKNCKGVPMKLFACQRILRWYLG
ncbi:hypothetical protein M5K25_001715 [Dendrobium thyrsiflorum]|uniref:Nucleoside phosphorylase domain-containing protein n=1 Tax=Dendrobium thyrsiflorum TaxID=117978 RepID=A0ABD0VR93_DENTH